MLSHSRYEKGKKNHLAFIKAPLNIVPPEETAHHCSFMFTLYTESHSKAFKIHWRFNVLLSHSTFYGRHPRLRLSYIHPKIYVREQSASWERTRTKDIVIQRFVSRMKGQHQNKRVISSPLLNSSNQLPGIYTSVLRQLHGKWKMGFK